MGTGTCWSSPRVGRAGLLVVRTPHPVRNLVCWRRDLLTFCRTRITNARTEQRIGPPRRSSVSRGIPQSMTTADAASIAYTMSPKAAQLTPTTKCKAEDSTCTTGRRFSTRTAARDHRGRPARRWGPRQIPCESATVWSRQLGVLCSLWTSIKAVLAAASEDDPRSRLGPPPSMRAWMRGTGITSAPARSRRDSMA